MARTFQATYNKNDIKPSSKSNTMKSSSYWSSFNLYRISTKFFITVTDAPGAGNDVVVDDMAKSNTFVHGSVGQLLPDPYQGKGRPVYSNKDSK